MSTRSNGAAALPTPEALLAAPDVSFWFKRCLSEALHRDPVDAAADAELLADVLRTRACGILDEGAHRLTR